MKHNQNQFVFGVFLILAISLASITSYGQTMVKGRVTDANSGDPVPFANIVFKGTSIGTTTDFDGFFSLETGENVDSLSASYVGYVTRIKFVKAGTSQTINFQLAENVISLQEIVFVAGENPAFDVLRKVVKNKNKNDKKSLEAYEYETYTKIEIDVDNITDRFKNRKIMQKITAVLDSVERIAGEDGKPILPIFISETISKYHYRNNPKLQHEKILKSKITGVGIEDGTLVSQFIGSSFQEYNFYQNWLNIVGKEFVSPIADGWRIYYDYDLTDSLYVDNDYCYRLDFFPRREQDLAFVGTMWITKAEYALKRIDVTVSSTTNLNYVEKIKIQQELEPTSAGPWIPVKNRVLIDVGEVTKNMAGVLAKFYTSNKNVEVNKSQDQKFYLRPIEVAEDFKLNNTDEYWNQHRHEPLTATEMNVYQMIDTLKSIPVVKTYTDILKVIANGYKKAGKLDLGPYLSFYTSNTVEGHRFQFGARTNIDFSNKWVLGGRLAYGTKDEEFKYKAFVKHIPDRDKWTEIEASYTKDLDQIGLSADDLIGNSVFLAASRFGLLVRPFYFEQAKFSVQRQLFRGYNQKLIFNYKTFSPDFNFSYLTNTSVEGDTTSRSSFLQSAEIIFEARYAKDELFVQNDNSRISIGTVKWPVISFRYTRGIRGVGGSDFSYNKVLLNIEKSLKMGFLGTSNFSLTGEHIFEDLPYPLLRTHIGNESAFFTTAAFNLMNFSEFTSDSYVSLKYNHFFQGFILNRIPLMKKLKWRLLATANVLYGNLRQANLDLIPNSIQLEEPIGALNNTPYIEVGYGVENIFKIIRLDFIHRLNYLDRPDVDSFGAKISFQFIL